MIKDKIYSEIIKYAKEIKLPATSRGFEDEIREAEVSSKSYAQFLHAILEKEYDLRKENGKTNRIRAAGFPVKKYLEDLKIEELPKDGAAKLAIFKSLDFIKEGRNIIFSGSTGTGNYRKFLFMERFSENMHKICMSINENLSIIFGNPYLQKPCSQLKRSVSSCQTGMSCVTTSTYTDSNAFLFVSVFALK
ncbi:MAG: ATP-binding protein [Actinobacteria bacterium]|nr:ATP-binding protein [Actinomycetota bacterium]